MMFARCKTAARWALLAALLLGGPWPAGFRTTGRAALAQITDPNGFVGIGAVVRIQGKYGVVSELVPGSPAALEGHLKVNDQITGVAQGDGAFVDCADMRLDKVVDMIRGKNGSTVRLQVIPAGAADPTKREVITLVRAEIKMKPQAAVVQPGGGAIVVQVGGGGGVVTERPELSPDIQAKLDGIEKKMADAQRKMLAEYMSKKTDEVAQATGLDEAGKKALAAAAALATDQSLKKSEGRIHDLLRTEVLQGLGAQMLASMDTQADETGQWIQAHGKDWPTDQLAWIDGLKQTLTAAQQTAWESADAKRRATVEKQIGDFLGSVDRLATVQGKNQLKVKVSRIQLDLNPPKDLMDKLDALADSVAAKQGDATRAVAEEGLLAMDDSDRDQAIHGQTGPYAWMDEGFLATGEPDPMWDEGVAKLLSPDVMKRLQAMREDRANLRAAAYGKLMVALLDERIAFTAAQRAKLEPIAQRLILSQPQLLADRQANVYIPSPLAQFYSAAATASAAEIQAILDPVQWQHWQDVSALKDLPDTSNVEVPIKLPAADAAETPATAPEPEAIERAISDYLGKKGKAEQERVVSERVLKAEDIVRVVHPSGEAAERLKTAALGEADLIVTAWDSAAEQMVRSNMSDATPDDIEQRLEAFQSYQFQNLEAQLAVRNSGQETLWDKTLKAELSPDQQKAWQQETDARSAYMQAAIATYLVAGFDQNTGLSPDQWTKLEPMISKIMADHGDDFGRFMMGSQGGWFLQNFTMFIPFAGIADADLKTVLTPEQIAHWKGSQQFSIANSYWSNIQMMHQQTANMVRRVKSKVVVVKKKAKPKPKPSP